MEGKWPSDEDLPRFKNDAMDFMQKCQDVSLKIMSCFADALDLPADYFAKAHDVTKEDCLTVLRCLHYHDITGQTLPESYWRAGAHTGKNSPHSPHNNHLLATEPSQILMS